MLRGIIVKIFLLFILIIFSGSAFASIKINSAVYDNSDSGLFFSVSEVQDNNGEVSITSKKTEDNRIYFDIKNAILTDSAKNWSFKNSDVERIKISQFSTSPNTVRVVFYHNNKFDPDYIKVVKYGNSLIFKYNHDDFSGDYFSNIYRESSPDKQDYLEKLLGYYSTSMNDTPQSAEAKTISTIDEALGNKTESEDIQIFKKLRTKFYINSINIKQGNALIYGIGQVAVKKPLILANPSRIVFDFPNTVICEDLNGKEYQLSADEKIKAAQFDSSTTRVVITTPNTSKYRPIFAQNLQSVMISNDDKIATLNLFNSTAKFESIKLSTLNNITDVMTLNFSSPVLYSVKNNQNNIEVILYNTEGITQEKLNAAFFTSRINSIKANKFSQNGYRIVVPSKPVTKLDVSESPDGRKLKITMKTPLEVINTPQCPPQQPKQETLTKYTSKTFTVVIDPGHGGADAGAVRNGINEKDINLPVSKKVADLLVKKGINVELTHWQDKTQSLQERVDFAQAKKADIFVSIHSNASSKEEIHGIETHYYHEYSKELASIIQNHLIQKTAAHNRGILQSKFYVINHTTMPAVLVEMGFISNNSERNAMMAEARRNKTAEAVVDGIIEFINKKLK